MRVLHCCLANFYIDDYGYQENVLPRMHKLQGHEVAILASTETYIDNKVLGYVEPKSYHTKEGIPVTRLPYVRYIPPMLTKKLRLYKGVYGAIESFAPDILFLHGCQFLSIRKVALYAKKHLGVKIYVDGHADLINSVANWVSKYILHKIIYKYCAKTIEPFVRKFYGTLPLRVEFFQNMYNIPAEKIELLPLGAKINENDLAHRNNIRSSIRDSLGIQNSDFIIVSGGKIDYRKNIHGLMRVVKELNQKDIKLIVFGAPNDQMKDEIEILAKHDCIKYVGWVSSEKTYDYLFASDLAVFPGTHSVLWEQAVGVGLPCVFKKWDGVQHVDLGGNCLFLDTASNDEIKNVILKIYHHKEMHSEMKQVAMDKGINEFSYYNIAQRAISG